MPDPLDLWLDTLDHTFRRGFYLGLAKAREEHAMQQNRKGLDTDALKHMRVAHQYEESAKTIGAFLRDAA